MGFAAGLFEGILQRMNQMFEPAFVATAQILEPMLAERVLNQMNSGTAPPGRNTTGKLYIRSGLLSGSWRVGNAGNATTITSDGDGVHIRWGSDVVYARVHEYGGGNAIPPRPYLTPAAKELEAAMLPILRAEIAARVAAAWQSFRAA